MQINKDGTWKVLERKHKLILTIDPFGLHAIRQNKDQLPNVFYAWSYDIDPQCSLTYTMMDIVERQNIDILKFRKNIQSIEYQKAYRTRHIIRIKTRYINHNLKKILNQFIIEDINKIILSYVPKITTTFVHAGLDCIKVKSCPLYTMCFGGDFLVDILFNNAAKELVDIQKDFDTDFEYCNKPENKGVQCQMSKIKHAQYIRKMEDLFIDDVIDVMRKINDRSIINQTTSLINLGFTENEIYKNFIQNRLLKQSLKIALDENNNIVSQELNYCGIKVQNDYITLEISDLLSIENK